MEQKVRAYVKKHHMLTEGDKVIAGISGGADSICLLCMLLELQKDYDIEVAAVHVHHGLRGAAADADEAYVRRFCKERGVPLAVYHKDVNGCAKEYGFTVEEAGREVRREAFEQTLESWNGTRIALAHHRDDNVETVLYHLCRGTGLAGLGGIAPSAGPYIRPLLCLCREEIESYLEKWEISYCTDETNQENKYTRNRIRNLVIPLLRKHVNERASEHIAEAAGQLRRAAEYMNGEARRMAGLCIRQSPEGGLLLEAEKYQEIPEALKSFVLHEVICEAAGQRKDIGAAHVRLLEELLDKQVGKRVELPCEVTARRCYGGVIFRKCGNEEKTAGTETDPVVREEFVMHIRERGQITESFPEKSYTKWFDYDIIKNTVKIRHREPGDYITINRSGGTQKLKQYFINEKIPQDLRDSIWLVADGKHIMWIVGYRQNQMYQVTDRTERILEIEFCKGENDGRDSKNDDQ